MGIHARASTLTFNSGTRGHGQAQTSLQSWPARRPIRPRECGPVVRQLLQDHYDLREVQEEQQAREQRAPARGPDGVARTRLETGHGRLLATLFGTVKVTRCAWRKPGAPNYCPADAALSLPAGRHSHSLAKLAALEAARGSFDAAHAAVARRCGPVIGKRQLEQAAVNAAADIPAFYAARVPEPCTP
jgi:hypothetical protein